VPDPNFKATMVTLREVDDPLGSYNYHQVIGRMWESDIAQTQSMILIVVPKGTVGDQFQLSPTSAVRVTYARFSGFGFAYVKSGWIKFTS
ncbi:hypothetical protein SB717_36105, partial [Priestia sp. SIMBA_032]|uniref:hypothetical protein n=1 Tax=Priestia sp. SIMBA_032 TaxID=3085775 RepID=UPI00397D03D2